MNIKLKNFTKNFFITALILLVSFFVSLYIHTSLGAPAIIPSLFVLAVFMIALNTSGYFFGIISALISVLAVNYAFTFPYFAFNFTIYENIISAVILILVTSATSTLTTEIKRQEKAKMQAEKERLRADLLRAVSHDLRTPLTTIYGSTSTVIENYEALSDKNKLEILNGIQKDSQWLIRMVENLLSITRLDSSKVSIYKTSVVVEELIDTVLAKFKKRYPAEQVTLSIPDEFLMVSADALLISQVLLNLLENVAEHAVSKTYIKLNISSEEEKVIFEVEDDGCGIAKDKLKNIFKGYYMSEATLPDNQKKCMGIGLSVCAAIIKAHNSTITAENKKSGGMIFRFSLELEEDKDE